MGDFMFAGKHESLLAGMIHLPEIKRGNPKKKEVMSYEKAP